MKDVCNHTREILSTFVGFNHMILQNRYSWRKSKHPWWLFVISQYAWVRVFRCPSQCVQTEARLWRFPVHWVYTTHQVFINARLICIYWFRGFFLVFPCCL
jgi:hypothetical protein